MSRFAACQTIDFASVSHFLILSPEVFTHIGPELKTISNRKQSENQAQETRKRATSKNSSSVFEVVSRFENWSMARFVGIRPWQYFCDGHSRRKRPPSFDFQVRVCGHCSNWNELRSVLSVLTSHWLTRPSFRHWCKLSDRQKALKRHGIQTDWCGPGVG